MSARILLLRLAAVPLALAAAPAHAAPAVTIYTHDLGFVRESRSLALDGARDTVRLEGVPERVDFPSVRLVPAESGLRVTRLAYRYDVASGDALVDRARGSRVRISSKGDRVTEGMLVSSDGGWLVVKADDGSLTSVSRDVVETVRLSTPPAGLALRPSLEAVIEGGRKGRADAELSYLTGGLSWSAEHVLVRRGESAATWRTDVTVDNQTGVSYESAALKLVAGEPRRTGRPSPMPRAMEMKALSVGDAAGEMTEQSFADYHLYTLSRPSTLRDHESQSLVMHEPREVKVAPRYFYRGGDPRGVTSQIELKNETAAGLGVPLPAGRVRFYEPDAGGALQFTGETTINHTAEGEKLTLDVGQAFDLVAERRELYNKRITDREREYSVEIKLRNRKKTNVSIVVQEGVGGDAEVLKKTHEFTRKDANTIEFKVAVPAGKEVVVRYTARVRY